LAAVKASSAMLTSFLVSIAWLLQSNSSLPYPLSRGQGAVALLDSNIIVALKGALILRALSLQS